MDKKKIYYLGLNLIVPGLGQVALGYYLKGIIMFIATIASFIYFCWLIIHPYLEILKKLSNDESVEFIRMFNVRLMILSFLALALIWLWSFIDIIYSCTVPEKEKENGGGNAKH